MSKKFMENYLQTYQKYIPDTKVKDNTKKTENSILDNNRKTTENSLEGSSNKDISYNNLNDVNSIQNSDIISLLSNDSKLLENFLMFQKFTKLQNLEKGIISKSDNVMVSNNEEKAPTEEIKTSYNDGKLEEINIDKPSQKKKVVIENNHNLKEMNSIFDEDRPIQNQNKNFIDLLEEKMQEETPNARIAHAEKKFTIEKKKIVKKNPGTRPHKHNKNNKYDVKDVHLETDNVENKVQQMDNNLDDEEKFETKQDVVKIEKIIQNIVKPKNNEVSNDQLSIKKAQLIQSKTKQLSSQTIPIKPMSEGSKNLNEKLSMEVNKMKEEIGNDDISEDKEEFDRENSVNSDDRNLSEILGLESKQNIKTNTFTQQQDKIINKPSQISNGNANSNNILKKYFGIQPKSTNNIKKISEVIEEDPVDHKQAERERFALIVNEKMKEINNEISKLKNENDKVAKLKGEFERNSNKLSKDIDEYNLEREDQAKEFDKLLEEEKSKFQREKKVHEKNIKAIINMPNKKEREEIDNLRSQLVKLNEDNKKKDQSYKLTIDRLKKQLEEAQNRISDMSKEVKFMEELKSKNWDKTNKNQSKLSNNIPSTNAISSVVTNDWGLAVPSSTGKIEPKGTKNKNLNRNESGLLKCNKEEEEKKQEITSKKNSEIKIKKNEEKSSKKESDNDKYQFNSQKEDKKIVNKKPNNDLTNGIAKNTSPIRSKEGIKSQNNVINTYSNEYNKFSNDDSVKNIQENKDVKEEEIEGEDLTQYNMTYPEEYHGKNQKLVKLLKQEISNDGKILKFYENNKKEVIFQSGVRKEIHDDGYTIVWFSNNDIKQTFPNGKVVYFFSDTNTVQNTFSDGLQVFKFEDGQIEKHYTDGAKEIIFPDKTIKYILPDGYEETMLPDGTLHKLDKNGIITIDHSNGDRENIYPDGIKVKEQKNGQVLKIYPDGKVEIMKNSL